MASTSRSVSIPSQNNIPDRVQRKRRLSASSDTSSDEEDTRSVANKPNSRSPLRRAVSVPTALVHPAEQPKTTRDKKKRRKKKRKVSVVQEPISPEKPLAQISNSPRRRTSISSVTTVTPSGSGPLAGPSTARFGSPGLTASSATLASPCDMSDSQPVARPSTSRASPHNNGHSNTIVSQVVNATISTDKGKGKAVEMDDQSTSTPSQIASTNQLPAHQNMLSSLLPTLTCRVCLFLMNRPFALAPCGHVACHGCLVSWFSQTDPSVSQDLPPIPALRRKKTCPHCRAAVSERPVEVWALKETIDAIIKSGLIDADLIPDQVDQEAGDAWKDIFAPIPTFRNDLPGVVNLNDRSLLGLEDAEDGGVFRCVDCMHEIWEGVCSGCHREYPTHRALFAGGGSESEDDGFNLGAAFANIIGRITNRNAFSDLDDLDDDSLSSGDEEVIDYRPEPEWISADDVEIEEISNYGGSFIDDEDADDHSETHSTYPFVIDEPFPPEINERPSLPSGGGGEGSRPHRDRTYDSSDESEDDIRSRGQSSRGARSVGRVIFSDESDEEEDADGDEEEGLHVPGGIRTLDWSNAEVYYANANTDAESEVEDEPDHDGSDDVEEANWSLQHQYSDEHEDLEDLYENSQDGHEVEDQVGYYTGGDHSDDEYY